MAKSVIGLIDNLGKAQAAVRELVKSGFAQEDVGFMADQRHEVPGTAHLNESEGMAEAAAFLISVAADDDERAALAAAVLERHGAKEIDRRDAEWKKQGWKGRFETEGYGGPERRVNSTPWLGPERRKSA